MFTGTPVVLQVTDNLVRITGLSLAAGASGGIGLHKSSGAPDIKLPASFQPKVSTGAEGQHVSLQDAISVTWEADAPITAAQILSCVKTGTTDLDFLATIANGDLEGVAGPFEIYVRFN